jgi:hypothetical protein
MPDPQAADLPAKVSAQPGSSSIHGDFINNSLPEWLIKASAQRRMQLKLNDLEHLLWFQALTLQQRTTLKAYTQASLHQRFESGGLTQEAYTQQSDDLEGQLQIEEAGLIERLSRQLLAEHPL